MISKYTINIKNEFLELINKIISEMDEISKHLDDFILRALRQELITIKNDTPEFFSFALISHFNKTMESFTTWCRSRSHCVNEDYNCMFK